VNSTDSTTEVGRWSDDVGIVVGLDDSPGSSKALFWAASRVERFGKIQPVSTWHYPWWAVSPPAPGSPQPPAKDTFTAEVSERVDRLLADIPAADRMEPIIHRGSAGPTLVEVARAHKVLVVGTRGRGAIADTLLGSVSLHCVSHADVPVIIVPPHVPIGDEAGRVVVGIDGSDNSVAALAWALDNSPDTSMIEAVHAWSFPVDVLPEVTVAHTDKEEAAATDRLKNAIEQAAHQAGGSHRIEDVVATTTYGDPRSVLKETAAEADMLVLGARGTGGISHLLLGSMTTAMCHQPTTTIAIIPCSTKHMPSSESD